VVANEVLTMEVAGFGRRLAALAIDWFVSIAVARILFSSAAYGSPDSSLATLLVFAAEVIVFTWLMAASFGQRVLGLRVVRTQGGPLGLARAALRTLLLCLVIPAIVIDDQGRGLHDRSVDSIVIDARAG
jgi:uncharacterized RDD family membrane protein YckC